MESAEGCSKGPRITEYEKNKHANVAAIKRKFESLNIPKMDTLKQPDVRKKRTKKTHNTSAAASEGPILRLRPQRNNVEITNDHIGDKEYTIENFLRDNEACDNGTQKTRKGRGITQMKEIFARTPDMPKIKIILNEYGQPVGETARKLASVIGCYVRKKLPIGCVDWRLVDAEKKYEVWTDIKQFYDVDDAAFNWFVSTAGRKWKDHKADLKARLFDETLSDEELMNRRADTVNPEDWNFLINFWRSSKSKALSVRGKTHRSLLKMPHTAGSISLACSRHDLGRKLGHPAGRDEVFVKTHTRKNGVPLSQASTVINELKAIVEAHPELREKTIQEGDAFAVVCGLKEPRGYVRGLGLGPTPSEIGTPGLKSYLSTKLQMERIARIRAESEKAALEQRLARVEQMLEERANFEITSQHGSNSRHQESPRCGEHEQSDCEHNNARGVEDDCELNVEHEQSDEEDDLANEDGLADVEENLLYQRQAAGPSNKARTHEENLLDQRQATGLSNRARTHEEKLLDRRQPVDLSNRARTHEKLLDRRQAVSPSNRARNHEENLLNRRQAVATSNRAQNDDVPDGAHNKLVGKHVILLSMLRSNIPVAKGTIIATKPRTIIAGVPLGNQFCEVIVNEVMKGDAILPRPYANVDSMANAYQMSIAWPYKKLSVLNTVTPRSS